MEVKLLVGLCVLQAALGQAWSSNLQEQLDLNPEPAVLYPWRQRAKGLSRVKRDWIIPPIRVSENSKQVPEDLVQIKSDKVFSGEVIYKLEGPGVDQDPKDLFEIDDRTGWIKSKMPLDREMYKSFTLKAFALSPSGERLENPTTIEIYILDQNDNKPIFVQEQFNGTVPEFSIPGTPVLMVSAEDADDPSTDNAMLSYSILQQESIPAFSINRTMFGINNTTGVIYTRDVGLDRTVVQGFRLTLQVADMSGIGLSSTSYANIYITDINNHPPRFSPDTYTMYVQENTDVPELGRVNATDRDEVGGENWRIKYTITDGDPNGNFAIHTDPLTNEGILSVEKPLDYESQAEHRLTLVAENVVPLVIRPLGDPISTATVTVRVRNENEAPRFHRDPIKVSAPESITPGTVLASDIAHDPDNAKLRFELRDPEGWLAIDEETGQISARAHFNIRSAHVKNNIYHAEVTVTDTDGGLSTTAALELTLWETNDFPPVLFPQSGIVCSNWEPHRRGLLVSAMDEDLSPHADPYTFDILSEMVVNWTIIQINETHAVLQPLMEMGRGEFSIQVLVSDSGSPVLASVWLVNVTVCPCDRYGDCQIMAAALLGSRVGISLIALIVIMASVALLLLLLLLSVAVGVCRRRSVKDGGGLLASESDEDVRDNVLNYDEQGGGEEDEDAFNIDLLRNPSDGVLPAGGFPSPSSSHPRGRQPLRKDAPHNLPSPTYPRKPPGSPTDIEDFINDGLDAADHDPNVPPYDTALIYDYEGDGSLAGSLSSVASSSSDGDQDYDYLSDWGPRFQKLANMYDPR